MKDFEPNKDDLKAQRVASLAARFMEAQTPVPSMAIYSTFYPELSMDSAQKAFKRDRESLAVCGLVVREAGTDGDQKLWQVDEKSSYAGKVTINPADAAAFAIACQPLLDDPAFPMSEELGFALTKVYAAFGRGAENVAGSTRRDGKVERALMAGLAGGQAVQIDYVDAQGAGSSRLIAPYGTFALRGRLYVVAARLDEKGTPIEDSIRTYRAERIKRATVKKGVRYEVPADFDVADYRKLPFQMGPSVCVGTFLMPDDEAATTDAATTDAATTLDLPVSSLEDAAAWAISMGARPTAPQELVNAWRLQLEGVLA